MERHLSKETVVILDSLNYIKGYRYELYCIARALRTPNCVVPALMLRVGGLRRTPASP